MPQERVQNRTVEQVVNVPVPQIQEEIVEVIQLVPQERISDRMVEQIVKLFAAFQWDISRNESLNRSSTVVKHRRRRRPQKSRKSRSKLRTHSTNCRLSYDRIQRTTEQVVNAQAQVQPDAKTVEV